MSEKNTTNERLQHILEASEMIFSYTQNLYKEEFLKDPQVIDAVIRRFEIIGEAARTLPKNIRDLEKEINWSEWIGFRNLLIHQYPDVKKHIVWQTIKSELSDFQKKITSLKNKL